LDPTHRELLDSPEFRHLVRRRWRVSLVLTALLFLVYYGYIVLIALYPAVLARRVSGPTTMGILMGVGVILASWGLTAAYLAWAKRAYDPDVARLRARATRRR
jgi:uncharacterized membrane protein (DUF485 family)